MKTRNLPEKNSAYYPLLMILVVVAVISLIFIQKYIGLAGTRVDSQAGTVTEILVDQREQTVRWAGIHGLVFAQSGFSDQQSTALTPGSLTSLTLVFDCVDPSPAVNEIYASLNATINFSNLRAGSADMIDRDYLNLSNLTTERANNTFRWVESILVGSTNISNIPAVYTYVNDQPDNATFFTGILNDSGRLVMVIKIFSQMQTSFRGGNVDYQAMLPIPNTTSTWYFFRDPNDECPAGFGSGQVGDAFISGTVRDHNTTLPIVNATVAAGGNTTFTDSSGQFNMTVPANKIHVLVAIKEGYNTNISFINVTGIGTTIPVNLTMSRFLGFRGPNGTIFGYVRDNSTGLPIANATLSIDGLTTESNATGNYSFTVERGTHVIAAVKTAYDSFVGNFSIEPYTNITFIINMTLARTTDNLTIPEGTTLQSGTIRGYVQDNVTGLPIANVTVTVAGFSNLTNSLGFYNITSLQGTTNLVAVKIGYNNYFSPVNITANTITEFNFSMGQLTAAPSEQQNGTITGIVRTSTGTLLSGVYVSVAGKTNVTNSTGTYYLPNIPPGTHNLVGTISGYVNHIAVINATEGATTYYNFTMNTTTEAGLGAGQGAGSGAGSGAGLGSGKGAGQGPGRGAGTGIPAQLQQPTKISDYEVSVKQIIKKLKVGNYITVPIKITNLKDESVTVRYSVEGEVRQLTRVDKDRAIIDGGATSEVTLTFLGNVEPGVYEGFFVISGDINERIPIYILVMEKDLLSVESLLIKITPLKRSVTAGENFKYTVDLQNLLSEEKYKVVLNYTIEGININRSIFIEQEEVVIHTSFSLLKTFKIPDDMQIGDYSLKVNADFLELNTQASTIFHVVQPFYKYAVFGLIPLWVLALVVGTLGTGTFGFIVYKKKTESKRRYKIELDLNALPKAGPRTAWVGTVAESRTKSFFDLDLFQIHTIVAGSSGSGKSVVAQVLVEEALLKNVAVVVFDPNAQWTGFLRKLEDKKLLGLYRNFNMKKTDARAFNGNVHLLTEPREIVDFRKMFRQGEIDIYVTSKLEAKDVEIFVANTIKQCFKANLPESKELKYLIVYDGIHSLLPKYGGTGTVFTQIERATREFRKWGIGLVLISQVVSDFPPEVLANINTEVELRTRDENDLNRIKEKYGEGILQSIVKAAQGTGIVQNSAYNKGKPYFVAFRPPMHSTTRISDDELENYNKYNNIIDDLEYQLDQLEKDGIDIFDLKLELKLSQDKVKSGNFNMVKIYLEGLTPRVKAQWDKLGKYPKRREVKFYDEGKLEEELKRAKEKKEERDEKVAQEAANQPSFGTATAMIKEESKSTGDSGGKGPQDNMVDVDDIRNSIDNLLVQIKAMVANNKKAEAIAKYSKMQELYKQTPKDFKPLILAKCAEAQKVISQK